MRGQLAIAALALVLSACVHVRPNGIEVESFVRDGMRVWQVPGAFNVQLAIVVREPSETAYGPQLAAWDAHGRLLHETAPLMDVNFIYPTFFTFDDRTLMLADYGNEDTWGTMVWSVERDGIRDLGDLDIATPSDLFTGGAASAARVEREHGRYVITIPGPLLLNPAGKAEAVLARKGEIARWVESGNGLELRRPRRN